MRPILAVAILLFAVSAAMPEPEYFATLPSSFHLGGGASLAEIESSVGKGNRQAAAAPVADEQSSPSASPSDPNEASASATLPLDQICDALMSSAQDNGLPVPFFANLLWQESGLRDDVVSSKGAMGIAQFMPETAHESGLANPLDTRQAISASARLLNALRVQFGNLGFAAAAYNAGPKRVSDWLKRGGALPRETRDYVLNITGRSIEQWQKAPPADADLRFVRRLPCRELPAFTELEQEQARTSPPEQEEKSLTAQAAQPQPEKPEKPKKVETARRAEREHERREARERIRREPHARHRRV
jgi:Transglycosylase SLT domain